MEGRMVVAYVLFGVMGAAFLAVMGLVAYGALRRGADRAALAWRVVDEQGHPVGGERFDDARGFAHGLAPVEVDGLWGYAGPDGTLAIPPRFRDALAFDASGHAAALSPETGEWGLIDRTGAWVLEPRLWTVGEVVDGVVAVSRQAGIRPTSGTLVYTSGLRRLDGSWIVEPASAKDPDGWLAALGPAEGRVAVKTAAGWGLVDLEGSWVVPPRYEELRPLSEGRAAFRQEGRWGYLDADGNEVIPARFGSASPFEDGRAAVRTAEGDRLIDRDGNPVGPAFEELHPPSEGVAAARDPQGRWGFVDLEGAWLLPPAWARVGEEGFRSGRARVAEERDGALSWHWIEQDGSPVGEGAAAITRFDDGRALARLAR